MLQSLRNKSLKIGCKMYTISIIHGLYANTNFCLLLVWQPSQTKGASIIFISITILILKLFYFFNSYFFISLYLLIYGVNVINKFLSFILVFEIKIQ